MSLDDMQSVVQGAFPHLDRLQYGINPLLDLLAIIRDVQALRCYEWNRSTYSALVDRTTANHREMVFLSVAEKKAFSSKNSDYHTLLSFLGNILDLIRTYP